MTYQVIDLDSWKRRTHCQIYRNAPEPMFCVTFEADITAFRKYIKQKQLSFTMAMVFAVCISANKVEALRYRFLNGDVVLYDRIDTGFTYLNKETQLFKVVYVPLMDDLEEYCKCAYEKANAQKEYFAHPSGNNVFQCSPNPWVTFTHISHTNLGQKENAMPVFDWGKYYEKDGRIWIPVSIQAHHSFVDGLHVGQFAQELQNYFDSFDR